jgi:hypothetical protein
VTFNPPVNIVQQVYRNDDRHDPLVNLRPQLLLRNELVRRQDSKMHRLLRIDVFFSNDVHIVKDFVVPDICLWTVHGSRGTRERE